MVVVAGDLAGHVAIDELDGAAREDAAVAGEIVDPGVFTDIDREQLGDIDRGFAELLDQPGRTSRQGVASADLDTDLDLGDLVRDGVDCLVKRAGLAVDPLGSGLGGGAQAGGRLPR